MTFVHKEGGVGSTKTLVEGDGALCYPNYLLTEGANVNDKPNILIVDDDEGICRTLTLIFQRQGYETDTAGTGLEALEKARKKFFNMAFLDIKLPDMDGVELLKPFIEMHPDTLLLITTAYSSKETAIKALNEGAFAYIQKPLNMDEVEVIVREALEKQRLVFEKRQADKALQESEGKLRAITNAVTDAIVMLDNMGEILFWNPAAKKIFGYSTQEVMGKELHLLLAPPEFHEAYKKLFHEFQKTGQGPAIGKTLEFTALRKDGTYFPIEASVSSVQLGGKWHAAGIIRDISDRKSMEEELKTSELKLQTVIKESADAIVIVSPEGVVRFFNPAAERLFGRNTSELIGSNIGFPMVKGESSEIALHLKTGETKLGEIRTVEVQWEGEKAYLASIRDVTDRKRMEEQLLKARKLESIGILAGGFAHDYNNLLSGIMGNLSMAQLSISPDHEAFQFIKEMEKATIQARDLTAKVARFAKGGEPIRKSALISPLLKQTVERVLGESDVKYELSIPDDLWPVEIDVYQIGQVIHNLLLNAVEAISVRREGAKEEPEPGIINLSAENIDMDTQNSLILKQEKYLQVSIEDNGIGIPEEDVKMIFDPYFSTKERGSRKGMGLGLSICHSIITRHEGNITVESEEGVGTTFHLYLPALDERDQ